MNLVMGLSVISGRRSATIGYARTWIDDVRIAKTGKRGRTDGWDTDIDVPQVLRWSHQL